MLSAVLSILVLALLIFVHELGHFLFAKWNGVTVLEFAIGFGRKLWSRRIGETRYSLRLIPLGGYVRMAGDSYEEFYDENSSSEEDEAKDKSRLSFESQDPVDQELLKDRSRWFFEKGVLARSSIVFAGPLFNFIFAWILGVFVFAYYGVSAPVNDPIIGGLIPDYPAEQAGIESGDRVLSINSNNIATWDDLVGEISAAEGGAVSLEVQRLDEGGRPEKLQFDLQGKLEDADLALLTDGERELRYLVGIQVSTEKISIGIGEALKNASIHTGYMSYMTLKGFWFLIRGLISPKSLAGPITIVKEVAKAANHGFERLLLNTIFISIALAVLNLLPIPVLDGGHLLFFLIEAVKGSPLNRKAQGLANQFGMVVLLLLMAFAIGNDIFRLIQ